MIEVASSGTYRKGRAGDSTYGVAVYRKEKQGQSARGILHRGEVDLTITASRAPALNIARRMHPARHLSRAVVRRTVWMNLVSRGRQVVAEAFECVLARMDNFPYAPHALELPHCIPPMTR